MGEERATEGVFRLVVGEAVALFGDRSASPGQGSAESLAERARATASALAGRPLPALFARQEHTTVAFSFGAERPLPPVAHLVGTCDALVTAERAVVLTVRTADCLPVVIAGAGVAAIVHAGWRGLAADILGTTVRRLASEYGVGAAELSAALGVAIGACHYPVGPEVVAALSGPPVAVAGWSRDGRIDIGAWAEGRLLALGISPARLRRLPGCTACSSDHHSFRRDGATAGRQWSAVFLP